MTRANLGVLFAIAVACPDAHADDDGWKLADVTDCKMLDTRSELVRGIWLGPWDGQVRRTLAPDTNAVYIETLLPVLPRETSGDAHFVLRGEFPDARFLSYHLYNEKFVLEGDAHLLDVEIAPDDGSVNPFVTGAAAARGRPRWYTLELIDFDKVPATRRTNTLRGGSLANGGTVKSHAVMIRYYDPERRTGEPPGRVAFPRVSIKYRERDPIAKAIAADPCSVLDRRPYQGATKILADDAKAATRVARFESLAGTINYPGYLGRNSSIHDRPEWVFGGNMVCTMHYMFPNGITGRLLDLFQKRFAGKTGDDFQRAGQCAPEFGRGAFNYDNRYIFSFLDAERGPAVMRMKRPKARRRGDPMVGGDHDVRYWSICVIQTENRLYTHGCARDEELIADPDDPDRVTFIVSTREERPRWACDVTGVSGTPNLPDCRYNWFPYVSPITWLYLRTLVGNPSAPDYKHLPISFELGTHDPNDAARLARHMGAYYPEGRYCALDLPRGRRDSCFDLIDAPRGEPEPVPDSPFTFEVAIGAAIVRSGVEAIGSTGVLASSMAVGWFVGRELGLDRPLAVELRASGARVDGRMIGFLGPAAKYWLGDHVSIGAGAGLGLRAPRAGEERSGLGLQGRVGYIFGRYAHHSFGLAAEGVLVHASTGDLQMATLSFGYQY